MELCKIVGLHLRKHYAVDDVFKGGWVLDKIFSHGWDSSRHELKACLVIAC